jgi:integrase/recombinase XerD
MPAQIVGPPWWREICAGYLRSITRKGRRPNTVLAYIFELRACGRWLDQEAIRDAEQLSGRHLEEWQDFRATEVAPATQQLAATAVRAALRWAAMQVPPLCPPPLWLHVITARRGRLMPRPIPREDLDRLLAALTPRPQRLARAGIPGPAGPELEYLLRLRTRALFLVILSSGARVSEALSLDRDQIRDRAAAVIQKGGSGKLLVVSAAAESAIADYLSARRDSCAALFVVHEPQQRTARRLARSSEQLRWDVLCQELGIGRFTTHQIRHSCATELLRQGVDSLIVAKHLGHHDLSSIAGYAEVGLDTRHRMLEDLDDRIRRAS